MFKSVTLIENLWQINITTFSIYKNLTKKKNQSTYLLFVLVELELLMNLW